MSGIERRASRICVVTSIHPDYDARVFKHACAVAEMGFEVDLVCPWPAGRYPLPPGLQLVSFPRVERRWQRPWIPIQILKRIFSRDYDLFHFHDLDILPLFAFLKVITGKPVIYDCHENYPEEMLHKAWIPSRLRRPVSLAVRWAERIAAGVIRDVVIVVPHQERTFRGSWFRRTVVRNFATRRIEDGRLADYVTRPNQCISIGSAYVDNGTLLYLDVAEEIARRRGDVSFLMVDRFYGNEALRERVVARISEPLLAGRFTLLPNVPAPDVMGYLNRATVGLALDLAVPHRIAALPVKLFEYMAAGIPIVAADLPNIRGVIDATECGLLAEPGAASQFASKICRLLDDRALAERLGRNGLEAFRREFNWESEIGKIRSSYERLLKS